MELPGNTSADTLFIWNPRLGVLKYTSLTLYQTRPPAIGPQPSISTWAGKLSANCKYSQIFLENKLPLSRLVIYIPARGREMLLIYRGFF